MDLPVADALKLVTICIGKPVIHLEGMGDGHLPVSDAPRQGFGFRFLIFFSGPK
jgi:hypothetical protein